MGNKEFHALLGALLDNDDLFNSLSARGISRDDFRQRATQFRYGDGKELFMAGTELEDKDIDDILRMMDAIRILRTTLRKPRC